MFQSQKSQSVTHVYQDLLSSTLQLTSHSLKYSIHSPKLSSILQFMDNCSMDDNFGEWVESMGVAIGRG